MIRPDETFVFGSNYAGRHGKGAALTAALNYGAVRGQGVGYMGRCYAIPTKDAAIRALPLPAIDHEIGKFIDFAKAHPEMRFYVTPVGCGLAGFDQRDIYPLFKGMPDNCRFAETWLMTQLEPEAGEHQVVIDALNGVSDDE